MLGATKKDGSIVTIEMKPEVCKVCQFHWMGGTEDMHNKCEITGTITDHCGRTISWTEVLDDCPLKPVTIVWFEHENGDMVMYGDKQTGKVEKRYIIEDQHGIRKMYDVRKTASSMMIKFQENELKKV